MNAIDDYIYHVNSGVRSIGLLEKLALQRHQDDLKRDDIYFDAADANDYIFLIENTTFHYKGEFAGRPFILAPWQKFIIACVFGWKWKKTGHRKYKEIYIEVAKKNGKTALMAVISVAQMLLDGEPAAEVYFAATQRDQARICFDDTRKFILKSPSLLKYFDVREHEIRMPSTDSFAKALGRDKDSVEGKNGQCNIVDEFHLHKDAELRDNLITATSSRTQPLTWTITTAGYDKSLPCYALRKYSVSVLKNMVEDDQLFSVIYSLDEKDDWNDPENWSKGNPNIGESVHQDRLEEQYHTAVAKGGQYLVGFKTKNLNLWTDSASVWITDENWMSSQGEKIDLTGLPCYGGLDLAAVRDLTCLYLVFPLDDGTYHTDRIFWLPEDTLKLENQEIYSQFVAGDQLVITPGNATSFEDIRRHISGYYISDGEVCFDEDCITQKYELQSIAFDRYNFGQMGQMLSDDGIKCNKFGQGWGSMSAPMKQMERLVLQKKFFHYGDPVMRWMISNVEPHLNPAGDIKPDKGKASNKIDGISAAVMALGEAITFEEEKQLPDDYEFTII